MNKAEYKEWYRQVRVEVRKMVDSKKYPPDVHFVRVPFLFPFYPSTPECEDFKVGREIYNTMCDINGEPDKKMPDNLYGEILVKVKGE